MRARAVKPAIHSIKRLDPEEKFLLITVAMLCSSNGAAIVDVYEWAETIYGDEEHAEALQQQLINLAEKRAVLIYQDQATGITYLQIKNFDRYFGPLGGKEDTELRQRQAKGLPVPIRYNHKKHTLLYGYPSDKALFSKPELLNPRGTPEHPGEPQNTPGNPGEPQNNTPQIPPPNPSDKPLIEQTEPSNPRGSSNLLLNTDILITDKLNTEELNTDILNTDKLNINTQSINIISNDKNLKDNKQTPPYNPPPRGDMSQRQLSVPYQKIVELWNLIAGEYGLKTAKVLSAERKRHIAARWKELLRGEYSENGDKPKNQEEGLEWLRSYFAAIGQDPFHRGNNQRGWVANLDYAFRQKTFVRLVEQGREEYDPVKAAMRIYRQRYQRKEEVVDGEVV